MKQESFGYDDDPLTQSANEIISEIDSILRDTGVKEDLLPRNTYFESMYDSGVQMEDSVHQCELNRSNGSTYAFSGISLDDGGEKAEWMRFQHWTIEDIEKAKLSESGVESLLAEIDAAIQMASDALVQEFTISDDLDFEREVRCRFVDIVLSIKAKRSENELMGWHLNLFSDTEKSNKQQITTVPYNVPNIDSYSLSDIQILNNLLAAIRDNNSSVGNFLTKYLLEVVCRPVRHTREP
ncbi:hypothetical protein ACOME3_004221 [Neoechinorhynchus agilis]